MGGRPRRTGVWIVCAAAGLGVVAALVCYLWRASGVNYTPGALLVVVSTAILLCAAAELALWRQAPAWLRALLLIGCIVDVLGTGLAAYFLHEWALLVLMAVAAVGWIVHLFVRLPLESAR